MRELVEIWKPVVGWEDRYMVSNLGRVKNIERMVQCGKATRLDKESIKQLSFSNNGYLRVNLFKDGKYKTYFAHRLVAEAFILNPDNKPCVDHINGDRADNRVVNLRWVTKEENQDNPITKERMVNSHKGNKSNWHKKEREKVQYDKNGKIIKVWGNTNNVKDILGISRQVILDACSGRCKTAGGSMWRFLDDQLADWLEEIQNEDMREEKVA